MYHQRKVSTEFKGGTEWKMHETVLPNCHFKFSKDFSGCKPFVRVAMTIKLRLESSFLCVLCYKQCNRTSDKSNDAGNDPCVDRPTGVAATAVSGMERDRLKKQGKER